MVEARRMMTYLKRLAKLLVKLACLAYLISAMIMLTMLFIEMKQQPCNSSSTTVTTTATPTRETLNKKQVGSLCSVSFQSASVIRKGLQFCNVMPMVIALVKMAFLAVNVTHAKPTSQETTVIHASKTTSIIQIAKVCFVLVSFRGYQFLFHLQSAIVIRMVQHLCIVMAVVIALVKMALLAVSVINANPTSLGTCVMNVNKTTLAIPTAKVCITK